MRHDDERGHDPTLPTRRAHRRHPDRRPESYDSALIQHLAPHPARHDGSRSRAPLPSSASALVAPASDMLARAHTSLFPHGFPRWSLAELSGRLVEIASWRAGAALTFALDLVLHAQEAREPAAWITPRERVFLPSDATACGVDLAALPVVRVADEHAVAAAGDLLARSGAFGLIVLDLESAEIPLGVLSRLAGLARAHATAIVVLTKKPPERASLGSFVSLRADARFERHGDGMFTCELTIPRDRRRAARWKHVEVRRGPPGLP